MIELHLGGCKQNKQALEVPNELYTIIHRMKRLSK